MVRKALKKWRKQKDEQRRRELNRPKEKNYTRLDPDVAATGNQTDPAVAMLWDMFAPKEPLLRRGMELLQAKKYDEALAVLTEAALVTPDDPDVYCERAQAHRALGHTDEALDDLNRAIGMRPWSMYLKERSSVLAHAGRPEEALADATEALRLSSGTSKAYYHHIRARRLFALGRYDEAIADCTEALRIYPKVAVPPLTTRARCRYRTNRHAEAIADWTAVLRLEPNNQMARRLRGVSRTQLEQWEGALEDLNIALAQEPQDRHLLWHRGRCHQSLERYEAAVADYTQLLAQTPEDARVLVARMTCLESLSRYEESVADAQALVRIDADDYANWRALAACLGLADRLEEALEAATRAIQVAPLEAENLLVRAQILRSLGRIMEAIADEEIANRLN